MKNERKKFQITFHTTTDAMAMERYCKKRKEPGRLIPRSGTISPPDADLHGAFCRKRGNIFFESDGGGNITPRLCMNVCYKISQFYHKRFHIGLISS